jgi:hypothetical protein
MLFVFYYSYIIYNVPTNPTKRSDPQTSTPKLSKAEKKARVAKVKKILVKAYNRNRSSFGTSLPTTARGALNQASVSAFLNRPENAGLVNRIYAMTAIPGVGFRTEDEVAGELNLVTIPTIFRPIERTPPTMTNINEEVAARDEERMRRGREELTQERLREMGEQIPTIREEGERAREILERTPAQREREARAELQFQLPPDILARFRQVREEESKKAKVKTEGKKREKKEKPKKKKVSKKKELGKKIEKTAVSSSSVPSIVSRVASRLVPKRPPPSSEERLQIERQRQLRQSAQRLEEAIGEPQQAEVDIPFVQPPILEEERLFTPAETERMIPSVPRSDTANVPADPVANQINDSQTGTLPQTASRPQPARTASSTQAIRLPQLDQQSINIISSKIPDPRQREIAEKVLRGEVKPNNVDNIIIRTIIRAVGGSGLVEAVILGINTYITNKLGDRRTRQILNEMASPITLPQLTEAEARRAEQIERERREMGAEVVVDLDALENFRQIGTPADLVERIVEISSAQRLPLQDVTDRVWTDVVDRALRQTIANNIDVDQAFQYLQDVRQVVTGLNVNIPLMTQDSVIEAITQRKQEARNIQLAESAEVRGRIAERFGTGAVAGGVPGAISGAVSGGMRGIAGRTTAGGAVGLGIAGGLGGVAGGAVGRKVGGRKGEKVGQVVGGVGAGAIAGYLAGKEETKVQEMPVEIPDQVVQQEEPLKSGSGKGTLRPKFIIPSVDILNKTDNEIQADLDEFSAFDFVLPSSEGTEGNISNNPLKRQAYIQNELILNGGGVDIPSQWGEEPMTSVEEQKEQMIGDKLSPIPELKMGVVDEDISVGFYTRKAQPNLWNAGSIKLDPLYYGFTRATDLNDNVVKSSLYGYQY